MIQLLLLCVLCPGLMLLTVTQRMMHSRVDQRAWAHIVTQMLLAGSDFAMSFGFTIVEIVVVGVVSEET